MYSLMDTFHKLLTSLQTSFSKKLPTGLSAEANQRLQRTLKHYMEEVSSVHGKVDEKEVLRETYDSMTKWFSRNKQQLTTPPTLSSSVISMLESTEDPDPLAVFERAKAARQQGIGSLPPQPNMFPELAAPTPIIRPSDPRIQAKDVLQKQEDVVKYREVEYNMILNSKDRDWVNGIQENRYKFSVQLDSAARTQGTGLQTTLTNRFRNITRIEFIKAILPIEGLEVVVPADCSNNLTTDKAFISTLSSPFINVVLDEITGNNYGTSESIDRSLAICQYDAAWRSENVWNNAITSRGFTVMIPKFMKAQRVYSPTPLASLQKMTFALLNSENQPISTTPDAFAITEVLVNAPSSCYYDASHNYLFVKTKTYFPLWSFLALDRLLFAGLDKPQDADEVGFNYQPPPETADLIGWLQQAQGHIVLAVAHDNGGTIVDGANDCGYANYIIIRNRFNDPTLGECSRNLFNFELVPSNSVSFISGAVLNASRQVQLVLRVITRELDSTTNLRPDNI
jgi:hypothetical protein